MSDDGPGQQARRAAEALLDGCENASDIAEYHGVTHSTGNNYVEALREHADVEYLPSEFRYEFDTDAVETVAMGGFETAEPEEPTDAGPDPDDLSERQQYIVNRIAADAPTRDELADDLGVDTRYVDAHLRDIREQGWQVNVDESSEAVSLAGDHTLRSSEHTGHAEGNRARRTPPRACHRRHRSPVVGRRHAHERGDLLRAVRRPERVVG